MQNISEGWVNTISLGGDPSSDPIFKKCWDYKMHRVPNPTESLPVNHGMSGHIFIN